MTDALETVIRHATDLDDEDIAPLLATLTTSGDPTLVPRLHQALAEFLAAQNYYGRELIARILAGLKGPAALPALLRAAAHDLGDDQDTLTTEIVHLLHHHRTAARPHVLRFATSPGPRMRQTGLWALGFIAEPTDLPLLTAAAADPDPSVRSAALGSLPNPAGLPVLLTALRDWNAQVRVIAASQLGYSGRPEATAPVAELATDPDARVRSTVAFALGRLGSHPPAVATLVDLASDPDPHVRSAAREALGTAGGPIAVGALLPLATDPDPEIRAQAARALAQAAATDPRAPATLTELTRDPEPTVRAAVLSGPGTPGGPHPWQATLLAALADDPDPQVRTRVTVTVRRHAPALAAALLPRYRNDPEPRIRTLADVELRRLTDPTAR